MNTLLQYF